MRLTIDDIITPLPESQENPGQSANPAPAVPVNTSTSTETVDVSGVQEATNKIMRSLREEGLGYAQAYEKYNPKPQVDKSGMQNTQKLQKAAVIADMIRLATEGVGAFAGANVQRRDSNVQGALAQRLLQQYAEYDKNLKEWNAKGVDAAMKDVQLANKLYERNLAAAPKTRTTVQDNAWDRQKHKEDKDVQIQGIKAADKRAAAANATRIQAANISKQGKTDDEKGLTTIVFGDNSGSAKIPKAAEKSFYNAAYQAMLNDPAYKADGKDIERIKNDLSFEGQAGKIKVYVDQNIHKSPVALKLLEGNAAEFNRSQATTAAPSGTTAAPQRPSGAGVAPWLQPKTKKAPWLK